MSAWSYAQLAGDSVQRSTTISRHVKKVSFGLLCVASLFLGGALWVPMPGLRLPDLAGNQTNGTFLAFTGGCSHQCRGALLHALETMHVIDNCIWAQQIIQCVHAPFYGCHVQNQQANIGNLNDCGLHGSRTDTHDHITLSFVNMRGRQPIAICHWYAAYHQNRGQLQLQGRCPLEQAFKNGMAMECYHAGHTLPCWFGPR